MHLVEQHVISKRNSRYSIIDVAALASKNLYNAANYEVRQSFIHEGTYLNYNEVQKRMQLHEAYKALPAKVSQQVLMQLARDWESFFAALRAYTKDPSTFLGRPKLPKYKHKTNGRNLLVYTIQAISHKGLNRGLICPSMLAIEVQTKQKDIAQVRIVPRKGFYIVEVVYEQAVQQADVNPNWYAGIDIGMNNLVALTANKPSFQPLLVNGRPVKSVNQFYNKRRADLQQLLGHTGTTKRMERLTNTRNRRVDHYLHTASKRIIDVLVQEGIGVLCIGKNDGWKQEANMGKRTNQHFVQIPHARFIFAYPGRWLVLALAQLCGKATKMVTNCDVAHCFFTLSVFNSDCHSLNRENRRWKSLSSIYDACSPCSSSALQLNHLRRSY